MRLYCYFFYYFTQIYRYQGRIALGDPLYTSVVTVTGVWILPIWSFLLFSLTKEFAITEKMSSPAIFGIPLGYLLGGTFLMVLCCNIYIAYVMDLKMRLEYMYSNLSPSAKRFANFGVTVFLFSNVLVFLYMANFYKSSLRY